MTVLRIRCSPRASSATKLHPKKTFVILSLLGQSMSALSPEEIALYEALLINEWEGWK